MERKMEKQSEPKAPCSCGCWPRTSTKGGNAEDRQGQEIKNEGRDITEGSPRSRQAKVGQER
jgi:hypothetical protein